MVETLIAFGMLRRFVFWHHQNKLRCNVHSVDHFVFGCPRMQIHSMTNNRRCGGVEVLILQLSNRAAIDGICPLRRKFRHIKMIGTAANLFIWRECNRDIAMGNRRISKQDFHRGDDFSNPRFVICT
ncbi:Uncharacterised protein [Vibrio cholerae]|uniref:Uncharacterized protein n=1 Tax=Vibrio cholerae TaxID=666 RepID=A0A655PSB4_VIBCL|nr:Uncharacterised protein [Vibrio cholerae]CSB39665.1 Uncharacterised protein [Vibrio cholerae]